MFYRFAKFYLSIICVFAFMVESIIQRVVSITKYKTLKIYNFRSSSLIYLKFLPDFTHCKIFRQVTLSEHIFREDMRA